MATIDKSDFFMATSRSDNTLRTMVMWSNNDNQRITRFSELMKKPSTAYRVHGELMAMVLVEFDDVWEHVNPKFWKYVDQFFIKYVCQRRSDFTKQPSVISAVKEYTKFARTVISEYPQVVREIGMENVALRGKQWRTLCDVDHIREAMPSGWRVVAERQEAHDILKGV